MMRRSTCSPSKSSRRRRAASTAKTSSSSSCGVRGRIARSRAATSTPSSGWRPTASPRGAVADLRAEVDRALEDPDTARALAWLSSETGLARPAAEQAIAYLAEGRRALGVIPTQDTLVLERFFDESGGMQLVLHAPFGSR